MKTPRMIAAAAAGLALAGGGLASATASTPASAAAPAKAKPVAAPKPARADTSINIWTAGGLVDGSSAPVGFSPMASDGSGSASYGGCQFYANSVSAGGYCPSGSAGGGTGPVSLRRWLWENGENSEFHPCRFYALPAGFKVRAPIGSEDGGYVLKACFADYDMSQPWSRQPDLKVVLRVQYVEEDSYERGIDWLNREIPDYMFDFWEESGNDQYYPIAQVVVEPTIPALVNSYTYFRPHWVKALDAQDTTVDPKLTMNFNTPQGPVTLRATMVGFFIKPQDEEGQEYIDCGRDPAEYNPELNPIPASEEDGEQPSTCWHTYEHSSADEEDETYTVRARARWRVTLETPTGTQSLGTFTYDSQQRMQVKESQPIVDFGDG